MSCEKIQERLSAWLDGEVDDALGKEIAAHLQDCAVCRREADLLTRLNEALANLEAPSTPEVTTRVLARLPRRASDHPWWRSMALAASLIMGVVFGHTVTGSLYHTIDSSWEELAPLDILQDFPQGSWGALLSYPGEEGNGA